MTCCKKKRRVASLCSRTCQSSRQVICSRPVPPSIMRSARFKALNSGITTMTSQSLRRCSLAARATSSINARTDWFSKTMRFCWTKEINWWKLPRRAWVSPNRSSLCSSSPSFSNLKPMWSLQSFKSKLKGIPSFSKQMASRSKIVYKFKASYSHRADSPRKPSGSIWSTICFSLSLWMKALV